MTEEEVSNKKTLRPYQLEVVEKLKQRLKNTDQPLLVNASVGSGKSLIIAEILLWIEKNNYKALCLTMNSTLIEQNANTYRLQGGNPGIYCAALDRRDARHPIIFGSPHSISRDIKWKLQISLTKFNLIIIDECHNVDNNNYSTMYMRIINHFSLLAQSKGCSFRIIGLTGTPYRGKNTSILGKNQLFQEEVCSINTSWLINQSFLVRPKFGLTKSEVYDFSHLRVTSLGKFKESELQKVIDHDERLTGKIMRNLSDLMKNRKGCFIFAATRKHCVECSKSLPNGEWAIITGETPHEERKTILNKAREGSIRYLISVNCLNVGVDVPSYDVCAWLRPTESLVLYTQGIGRILRLFPGKNQALVMDYAGNLQRHGDVDNPIINEALQPTSETEKDYVIPCLTCGMYNTVHARRCIGVHEDKRCDHYFQWKNCHVCDARNDLVCRHCHACQAELIDPNTRLDASSTTLEKFNYDVLKATYTLMKTAHGKPLFRVFYTTAEENEPVNKFQTTKIFESYVLASKKGCDIFYHKFIKIHHPKPSETYRFLGSEKYIENMILGKILKTPNRIECVVIDGSYKITDKFFLGEFKESIQRELLVLSFDIDVQSKSQFTIRYLCEDEDKNHFWVNDSYSIRSKHSRDRLSRDFPECEAKVISGEKDVNNMITGYIWWNHPVKIIVDKHLNILERSANKNRPLSRHIVQYDLKNSVWELVDFKLEDFGNRKIYKVSGIKRTPNEWLMVQPRLYKDKKAIAFFENGIVKEFECWSHAREQYITKLYLKNNETYVPKEGYFNEEEAIGIDPNDFERLRVPSIATSNNART